MWNHENDDAPTSGLSSQLNKATHPASPEQAQFLKNLARTLAKKAPIALPANPMLRWDYGAAAFTFDLPRFMGRVEFQRGQTRVVLITPGPTEYLSRSETTTHPACAGWQG